MTYMEVGNTDISTRLHETSGLPVIRPEHHFLISRVPITDLASMSELAIRYSFRTAAIGYRPIRGPIP
jgi:hypothetical protein